MFSLTGCYREEFRGDFEEEHDFSPPAVVLSNGNDVTEQTILTEVNIDWQSKEYNKETKDIISTAKKKNKMYFHSGEQVDLLLDSGDIDIERTSGFVWKNDKKLALEFIANLTLVLPKEKGEYVLVIDLHTDRGTAQYVGNMVVTE